MQRHASCFPLDNNQTSKTKQASKQQQTRIPQMIMLSIQNPSTIHPLHPSPRTHHVTKLSLSPTYLPPFLPQPQTSPPYSLPFLSFLPPAFPPQHPHHNPLHASRTQPFFDRQARVIGWESGETLGGGEEGGEVDVVAFVVFVDD